MLLGSQGCSDDKNWLDFSSIFLKISRFRSSILLSLKVFFPRGVAWFSWTNHNSLLPIATNEIASFCIDNRSRQMSFFLVRRSEQRPAFALCWRILKWPKALCSSSLFCYYIKQINSMLPWVCSAKDHRRRQNVVSTSVTHSAIASLNRRTATWNVRTAALKKMTRAVSCRL